VQRQRIIVEGIVQGVGFRPFIYSLAQRHGVSGWVCNDTRGVTMECQAPAAQLAAFRRAIEAEKPPLASISSLSFEPIPLQAEAGFAIRTSRSEQTRSAQISPDTYVCDDCRRELFDLADRRYGYPFINCTNCGPRYTIVTDIPYDRPLTTMADFPMCAACQAEYDDPSSRRFHAQPNACPDCGPQLALLDAAGASVEASDLVAEAARRLHAGEIVAIKGIGGFHLAVDATNPDAVQRLRQQKQRDEKPFALMSRDLAAVEAYARVSADEARLLAGCERPIVLLNKRAGHSLAEAIAPRNRYFGVMLPYAPLHYLLLEHGFAALVMTSANLSDEPIAYQDAEARQRLAGVADCFLVHNRRIHVRTDDSIARVMAGKALLLRRSRGFVPRAVFLPQRLPAVLATGAELKNAVCLTRGNQAFLSQHVGDLKNLGVYESFKSTISHLRHILEVNPEHVAHDLHPDYYSTRYALEESGLPCTAVQHHHAHLASCLAEHGLDAPALGVIFDGVGYGADGHIWGGEFLAGDLRQFERLGHFRYQPMPGGDLATREPWRMALSCLLSDCDEIPADSPALAGIPETTWRLVAQATQRGLNAPLTSSCGRLFDAVAALVGLRRTVSYEGQAALELEMVAEPGQATAYPYLLENGAGPLIFNPRPLLQAIVADVAAGVPTAAIAGRFHVTLATMIEEVCSELRQRTGLSLVVLSGGVFQNRLLTELSLARLERAGFKVLTHALVPPNDGGIALGQAVVAASRLS